MIVVDANVWVAVFHSGDVFNGPSERWLLTVSSDGEPLNAPTLVLPEVAGALVRRTGSVAAADHGRRFIERAVGSGFHPVDAILADLAARLAADLGPRGADAVYVALAARLACPLVTWDAEMMRKTRGVIDARQPEA